MPFWVGEVDPSFYTARLCIIAFPDAGLLPYEFNLPGTDSTRF